MLKGVEELADAVRVTMGPKVNFFSNYAMQFLQSNADAMADVVKKGTFEQKMCIVSLISSDFYVVL